jgi:outer membrane protein assembly factor BamB
MDRRAFLKASGSLVLIGCGRGAGAKGELDGGTSEAGAPQPPRSSSPPATSATVAAADAGGPDAGEDAGLERAEHRDEAAARAAQGEAFPEWDGRTSSTSPITMLMFRGNPRRNFHGTGPVPTAPVLKWRHAMGTLNVSRDIKDPRHWTGTGWTGQAVKWGTRVYVGGLDGRFYCWEARTGHVVWTLKTARMFKSSACFYDGRLYVGNVDNKFRCIDARNGDVLWKHDMKSDCDSSPVVVDDTVYAASESGFLHAFEPETGRERYKMDLGGHRGPGGSQGIESSPAVDGDELWVANYDGVLFRIDRIQGKVLAKYPTGDDTDATPVLTDTSVFVAAEAKNPALSCIDRASGEVRWTFTIQGGFWSTPAVVDGRLYVGGDDSHMYCLDARTGKTIWSFAAKRAVWSSPCVVDGKVLFGSYDGFLYMLDAASGREVWRADLGGPVLSTPCIVDGWIWIGSGDGHFYCFGPKEA